MDAGTVLKWLGGGIFCLLFCYLFLDRFLFARRLDALLFGRPLRRLAELLECWARKTGVPADVPQAKDPFRRDTASVPEDDLVPRGGSLRHIAPKSANARQGGESAAAGDTFASATAGKSSGRLPEMFTDPVRIAFYDDYLRSTLQGQKPSAEQPDDGQTPSDTEAPHDAVMESASPGLHDCGQRIGPRELEWIIRLCNGQQVAAEHRAALVRAVRSIQDTQIYASLLESISGSDDRIARFLDQAEAADTSAEEIV